MVSTLFSFRERVMSSERYEEKVRGVEVYTTMEPCMSQTVEYRGLVVASKVLALLSLVELLHYFALESFIVMLRQLSYSIKNQLKAPKAPY